MYIKKTFPISEVMVWSWRALFLFVLISTTPVALYTILGLRFLSLPWLPIAVLGTAVAFIMGFKNNVCYDRIWEARKIWGGIINNSRSWGIMVRDFIRTDAEFADQANEENEKIKRAMIDRHIAWLTALRYALRESKPWEMALSEKSNAKFMEKNPIPERIIPLEEALKPYIDAGELSYIMGKTNKAAALLSIQSKQIEQLERKGVIWKFSYLEMKRSLMEFFDLQGKTERIKNFPYPRQFATLNFWLVWIFVLLLPYGVMGRFNELGEKLQQYYALHGGSNFITSFMADHFIWLSIPFCTIISWVFNTIERVGEVSENPFEGTANDVPITTMCRNIEIDLLEMMDEEQIPAPLEAVNHIML